MSLRKCLYGLPLLAIAALACAATPATVAKDCYGPDPMGFRTD